MAKRGENLRDLPQLLSQDFALKVVNYIITSEGGLIKRKGLEKLEEIAGNKAVSMLTKYTDDLYMYAYDTTLAVYSKSADTSTVIKADFSANTGFDGQRYGDYFFIVNGEDPLGRIDRRATFNAQSQTYMTIDNISTGGADQFDLGETVTGAGGATGVVIDKTQAGATGSLTLNAIVGTFIDEEVITGGVSGTTANIDVIGFQLGDTISGGTSNATAVILEKPADDGSIGTLVLGRISGTFVNGEVISGGQSQSATLTSAVTYNYTSVTAGPTAKVLKVIGSRLFAGNLKGDAVDAASVRYSETDTGTNPPFTAWSNQTNATAGGSVNFKGGGDVLVIENLGGSPVVFQENGKFAFSIDTIDSGGTLTKVETILLDRTDYGGSAALNTKEGLFYVNESGLFRLVGLGNQDIPFSDQEEDVSVLLGNNYFNNINLSNANLVYDERQKTLFITCARDSATNNFVIAYNVDQKAFSELSGWAIRRFMNDNGTIYGSSSVATKLYECFTGYDDDGLNIGTEYYQELQVGGVFDRKALTHTYIQGFLSQSTQIQIRFDIYDRTGRFVPDKRKYLWEAQLGNNLSDGFGTASWGISAFGGDIDLANTVESFDGRETKISSFQRLRVRLTSGDKLPHAVNWLSVLTNVKSNIRIRKLTKL